jgi:hypothetical protein
MGRQHVNAPNHRWVKCIFPQNLLGFGTSLIYKIFRGFEASSTPNPPRSIFDKFHHEHVSCFDLEEVQNS